MRIIQRLETDEVKILRELVKYRFNTSCGNCKTSYEADWEDLEGFMDPESYLHVHCPVCDKPAIVDTLFQPSDAIMGYLRDMDVATLVEEDEDGDC